MKQVTGIINFIILILYSFFFKTYICCGITTHIETGYRAKEYVDLSVNNYDFKTIIEEHDDAFQAGCPFPDAMYPDLCYDGIYHSIAEDTHWTPIMNATINFLRNIPQPWDKETEKLLSFLLGIYQHQIADVNWHSLGITQGFIRAMSKINYHNNFSPAHSDADFGGDVVNVFNLDTSYIEPTEQWYVPDKDMEKIYQEFYGYHRVNASVLTDCAELLYLGRLGEHIGVIEILYPEYAEKSPFLVDEMNDYFLGGINDMASWVLHTWRRAAYMMKEGTDKCEITKEKDNPIHMRCPDIDNVRNQKAINKRAKNQRSLAAFEKPFIRDFIENYRSEVERIETDRGTYLKASPRLLNLIHKANEKGHDKKSTKKTVNVRDAEIRKPNSFISTGNFFSNLGQSLLSADINNDGFNDLLITAPHFSLKGNYQIGRVYVVYSTSQGIEFNGTIDTVADITLTGKEPNGRFGKSIAMVDFNADGYLDLAVSAPSVGLGNIEYKGHVYIFYGTSDMGLSEIANVTITCEEKYCNFGESLTSGDINGDGYIDLLIGSPKAPGGGEQRGFAAVFYSKKIFNERKEISITDADWIQNGQQNYEWFGLGLTVDNSLNSTYLLIPSPTWRICFRSDCQYHERDVQSVGKLSIYRFPLENKPFRVLTGNQEFQMFSARAQFANPFTVNPGDKRNLVISSLAKNVDGKVNDFPNTFIHAGSLEIFDIFNNETITTISGDREFSRHGSMFKFYDLNDDNISDLLISSPLRCDDYDFDEKVDEGRIYIFLGGSTFPLGNKTQECIDNFDSPCLMQEADFVLNGDEEKSHFGKSIAIIKNSNMVQIAVGMPHNNKQVRLGGKVVLFNLN